MQAKVDGDVGVGNEAAAPWARMPWAARVGVVGAFLAFVGCAAAFVWPFLAWWGGTFVEVYVRHGAPEPLPAWWWPWGAWWLLLAMAVAGAVLVALAKPYWPKEESS